MNASLHVPAQAILRFVHRLARQDVCLHGFELRHGGEIRAEGYYAPFAKGAPHRMYSVSKSMVSLAVGLLAAEGKIDVSRPIAAYFPERLPQTPDPRLLRVTVRDMLRMTTCYARTVYADGVDADWTQPFFTAEATHEAGTVFAYDTSSTQTLGALCEKAAGMGLLAYLDDRVFQPIGATDAKRWLKDPCGTPQGGTGLLMSLRDLGKVAQLVMDGGAGLLPAAYLAEATSMQSATPFEAFPEIRHGYGLQFWRNRAGYSMYGMGGQLAICCPQKRLLLSTIGDTRLDADGVQHLYDAFFDEVYGAQTDAAPDADAEEALARVLAGLRVGAVPHDPGTAVSFAPVYRMEPNALGLTAVRFTDHAVTLVREGAAHTLAYGVGEVREGVLQNTPCLVSGGFARPGLLRVRCHLIGDAPCGMELLLAPRGAQLSVQARRSINPLTEGYEGFAGGVAMPTT